MNRYNLLNKYNTVYIKLHFKIMAYKGDFVLYLIFDDI